MSLKWTGTDATESASAAETESDPIHNKYYYYGLTWDRGRAIIATEEVSRHQQTDPIK